MSDLPKTSLRVAVVAILVVAAGWIAVERRSLVLGAIAWKIEHDFPSSPGITTDQLCDLMAAGESLVLLDVRRAEEFAVSHLPDAVRVEPGTDQFPAGVTNSSLVVAYCSVGYRSAQVVEQLRAVGINAVNLEGSIFEWVEQGRPLEQAGRAASRVHPYGTAWQWLVAPSKRTMVPAEALLSSSIGRGVDLPSHRVPCSSSSVRVDSP